MEKTKTKLQLWTDVSQIIGAVAVVISLVYVGIEIRGNTEATRAATRQTISQTDIDFIGASLDPEILIVARSKEELGEPLTDVELLALLTHQHLNFRIFENAFYQHRSQLLADERWETYEWIISLLFHTVPSVDSMWTAYGPAFDDEFRSAVEEIRARPFEPR